MSLRQVVVVAVVAVINVAISHIIKLDLNVTGEIGAMIYARVES